LISWWAGQRSTWTATTVDLPPRKGEHEVKWLCFKALAVSESPVIDATLFAIEEINRRGGSWGGQSRRS